jgi:hypothetical protein
VRPEKSMIFPDDRTTKDALLNTLGDEQAARRDFFVGVPFLGGCGVLVVLTIVTGVIIIAEGRSAGQSQKHRRPDTD